MGIKLEMKSLDWRKYSLLSIVISPGLWRTSDVTWSRFIMEPAIYRMLQRSNMLISCSF